ncbi:transmembrane protein 151B-like [Bacillus rossius redtenbacheri]|uniref:transmembrane protein 151B-like n=1 Tax=Bacillus rossius redtenbacheri TaxID=93214 RepID=UPI002FDD36FE
MCHSLVLQQRPIQQTVCGALQRETNWKCLILTLLMCHSLVLQQRPIQQTVCGALQRETNWKCLILTLLMCHSLVLQQRPIQQTVCGALQRETNWKCLILTLLMCHSLVLQQRPIQQTVCGALQRETNWKCLILTLLMCHSLVLQQRPIQQTVCGALQRETNWKCLILTLLIYGCLGAVAWCRVAEVTKVVINFSLYPIKSTRQMSPCDDGYVYIPVAFMLMLYLVYLVECWHCTARIELGYRVDARSVLEKVRQMREALPIVWWKAVCYHYVRRKRQVTRYRNGDAYTTTQVYYERVNSHAAGSCFVFACCGVKDVSRELALDLKGPITKIRFSKGFAFSNLEAAAEFEDQRARFFSEHERYDDYMEMREGLDLSNVCHFKEYVVAYSDPDRLPWYSRQAVFWACSLLLLSWPLRMVIECNTSYVHYQVTKLFGVNYDASSPRTPDAATTTATAPAQTNCDSSRGELSHDSTIDSGDLEACIRDDNHAVAPSYSESLLMEAARWPGDTDGNANLPSAESSYSVRAAAAGAGARRSWGGSSSSRVSAQGARLVFLPGPLADSSPRDPLRGRGATTPADDPPAYEDALRLPALTRLRRSLTARGDICRRESADTTEVVVVSDPERVRLQPRSGRLCRQLVTMETSL